jgi:hypothetical protein
MLVSQVRHSLQSSIPTVELVCVRNCMFVKHTHKVRCRIVRDEHETADTYPEPSRLTEVGMRRDKGTMLTMVAYGHRLV